MEFPELGKHCHNSTCKQLDFLPMICDGCAQIFCKDHFSYDNHSCPEAHRKNFQVPVCPLCNEPVAFKRGELPDIRVSEHIDRECKSDPATVKRQKIYTNRCNKKGCKTKELVKITCDSCRLTYCLKHRHEADHECGVQARTGNQGPKSSAAASRAGAAALQRFQSSQNSPQATSGQPRITQFLPSSANPSSSNASRAPAASNPSNSSTISRAPASRAAAPAASLQPRDLTEDEALARAMSLSLQDSTPPTDPVNRPGDRAAGHNGSPLSEDEMLARAIAASEEEERRRRRERNSNQNSNQTPSQDSRANCAVS